jgi:hypothetical protein
MSMIDLIKQRRSIRAFTPQRSPWELILDSIWAFFLLFAGSVQLLFHYAILCQPEGWVKPTSNVTA